jgi:hypothetical protein
MTELHKVLEDLLKEDFVLTFVHPDGKSESDRADCRKNQDLLYFPRPIAQVRKVYSGMWEPGAWFIHSRTKRKATRLERPTELTGEALSSGYRSGIVLDNSKHYIKFKGITLKGFLGKYYQRGECDAEQAFYDHFNSFALSYMNFPLLGVKPKFLEAHVKPNVLSLKGFLEHYNHPRLAIHAKTGIDTQEQFESELDRYERFTDVLNKMSVWDYCFVSAAEVKGDTRLDETIYHLTKVELQGQLKKARDNILRYLAFRAGVAKAHLTEYGYCWGKDLSNTDNHIGNFIVGSNKGLLTVSIADLCGARHRTHFQTPGEFTNHIRKEMESLAADFQRSHTFSLARDMRYRFFPAEMREQCISAMLTGYEVVLLYEKIRNNSVSEIVEPTKIVAPGKMITDEEFRHECRILFASKGHSKDFESSAKLIN